MPAHSKRQSHLKFPPVCPRYMGSIQRKAPSQVARPCTLQTSESLEVPTNLSSVYGIYTSRSAQSSGASLLSPQCGQGTLHGTCHTYARLYTTLAVRWYLLAWRSQRVLPFIAMVGVNSGPIARTQLGSRFTRNFGRSVSLISKTCLDVFELGA
jgi:hypothetical protein